MNASILIFVLFFFFLSDKQERNGIQIEGGVDVRNITVYERQRWHGEYFTRMRKKNNQKVDYVFGE